jgi:hypothetical protein
VFSTQFLAVLGHVLLGERIAATILAIRYENSQFHAFSVCWFTLLVRIIIITYTVLFDSKVLGVRNAGLRAGLRHKHGQLVALESVLQLRSSPSESCRNLCSYIQT